MSEKKVNITSEQSAKKKQGNVLKKLIKTFLWIFVIFIVSILLFILLFQFYPVRKLVIDSALNIVNNELLGKIEIDDLKIHIFKGIQIENIKVFAVGDTFADIKTLQIKYRISPLLKQNLILTSISLENPRIKLIRSLSDSLWNFEKIAKPSEDTTEPEKLNWLIDVKKFFLVNGVVSVYDSISKYSNSNLFNPGIINISDLNIELEGSYNFGNSNINAKINKFSFSEKKSNLKITNLTTDLKIDTNKIEIKQFNINTENSGLNLSASINNLNIFGDFESSLDSVRIYLSLQVDSLDNSDIAVFTSSKNTLNTKFKLATIVEGNFNELDIENLYIDSKGTSINLNGNLRNILDPDKLNFTLILKDSKINYYDLTSNLPNSLTNSIPKFDKFHIKTLSANGSTKELKGFVNLESDLGNIITKFDFQFNDIIRYAIDIEGTNINLQKSIPDKSLNGNINIIASIRGEGSELKKMNSDIKLNIIDSKFLDYNIKNLNFISKIKNSIISFDTLDLRLFSKGQDTLFEENPKYSDINLNGLINLTNPKKPEYQISGIIQNLNLAQLTENELAPQVFTGNFFLNAKGIDPDSIFGTFFTEVEECLFGDRALLPFVFFLSSEFDSMGERKIKIESDLMNLDISGNFNFTDFEDFILNKGIYIADFITDKVNLLAYIDIDSIQKKKTPSLKEGKLTLVGKIKDVSPVNIFLDDAKMSLRADLSLNVHSTKDSAVISLDSLNLSTFRFKNPEADININPVKISSKLEMVLIDSVPVITSSRIELMSDNVSYINGLSIEKPNVIATIENDSTKFAASASLNNSIKADASGLMTIEQDRYNLTLENGNFQLNDSFKWSLANPLVSYLDSAGLFIESLKISREKNETIDVRGRANLVKFDSLNIRLSNLNFDALSKLIPEESKQIFNQLTGKFEFVNLVLNDSLSNPDIKARFKTGFIIFNDYNIGILNGNLNHKNAKINGELELMSNSTKLLTAKIDTLPIDLSISDVKERFHSRNQISIDLKGKSIPLEMVSSFIPQVENLKGTANAELKLTGFAPDNFVFNGFLDILNSSFIVTPNNMRYTADGLLLLYSDSIVIKKFNLYNTKEDLADGLFQINGKINLFDYQINDFDFYFNTKRFKVLNRGSIKNMPTLYGDFIISTSTNPLRLYGTMKTPTLAGDINVFGRSELFMPLTTKTAQSSMTAVRYEFAHNPNITKDTINPQQTKEKPEEKASVHQKTTEKEVGFADLLNYDIYLRILEPFTVTMELNQLGQVFAIIGTPDRFLPLHYEVSREDRIPKLSGSQLVLKEGSRLKYFKIFETSGNIFFPTGSIDDPGIDLTAVYKGYSMKDNRSRPFEVIMKITGTKNKPSIKFDYILDGNPAVGDSSVVSQDALFLLVMGKTKSEFESSSQKGVFDFGELSSSGLSSYISKLTTELLQGTGIIQNAEINFASGSFELDKAELRLSGQLFGNVTWRVGGTIADISANNEFSIDIPLNFFQQTDILNNIAIQLTRATNLNQTISRNQKEWEVKIKFGGSF